MKKEFGIKRLFKSFQYSMEGLIYAFRHEQNIWVHLIAAIVVILSGIYFQLHFVEWLLIAFAIGLVISAELLNTALEATVDLITTEIHPFASFAKGVSDKESE